MVDDPNSPAVSEKHYRPFRKYGMFVLKIAVAAGLLFWLVRSDRLDFAALGEIRRFDYLVWAGIVLLASMLMPVWRWLALVRIQKLSISTGMAIRLTWLGYFAGLFLPGATGGDLVKAYAACRHRPSHKTRAVSTVLFDRAYGMHSLLAIAGLSGVWIIAAGCTYQQSVIAWFTVACFAIVTAVLAMLLVPLTSNLMVGITPKRFRQALTDSLGLYRASWGRMMATWVFSCLCNLVAIVPYLLVAAAMRVELGAAHVLSVPLVIVSNGLPISPGGLGVGETVGAELSTEFGLASGGMMVIITRLGFMALSIPGAFSVLGRLHRESPRAEKGQSQ